MASRVVVTGATGHLGANLVPLLLERGRRVRCLVHRSTGELTGLPVETVPGDVLEPASLRRAFSGAAVCFHLAGVVSISGGRGGLVERVNVDGAANVAAACRKLGLRLIHCSSVQAVFLRRGAAALDETAPLNLSADAPAYDQSKARGVLAVRREIRRGLEAVVCYPTAVLGPRDYTPSRMGCLLLALARRKLPCLVEGGFDWIDARDVARGLLAAAERGRCDGDYLLGGHYLSLAELARRWCALLGVPAPRLTAPPGPAQLGAPIVELYHRLVGGEPLFTAAALRTLARGGRVDCSRARRELGYTPRPFDDTLRATADWFQRRGLLSKTDPSRR